MLDTPTFNSSANGGNFMTYNPLNKGSYTDLSEGNLKADSNTSADATYPTCTFGVNSGKWYVEHLIKTVTGNYPQTTLADFGGNSYNTSKGIFYAMRYHPVNGCEQGSGTNVANFGTITVTNTSVATLSSGDIVSWYIDMDNKKAWIAKNGSIPNSGDPANGTNPQFSWTENPINSVTVGSVQYQTSDTILNAGQDGTFAGEKTAQGNSDDTGYDNFYYDPPTGFLAMCSGNLPVADAVNPAETDDNYPQKMFNPLLYTGDGGSSTAITGVGFQPDWVWIKRRNATENNNLYDSTRGVNERIQSNRDVAETTEGLPAFGSDGFTVDASGGINNVSSQTYVAWNWRANGGTTSTNSTGTVNATQQVDPSGGFSISTYAGTGSSMTVGHGLSAEPKLTIVKDRDATVNWIVYTKVIDGSLDYFFLNTDAAAGDSGFTGPNSTIWNFDGSSSYSNTSGRNYIMYNFTNVEGYCKVGKYIGNGAGSDGAFVYTGFRPAWVLVKKTTQNSWRIQDNARDLYNPTYHMLKPQSNAAEDAYTDGTDYNDFLSNGFKLARGGDTVNYNANGSTYVYLAMAHNPFKYATAR